MNEKKKKSLKIILYVKIEYVQALRQNALNLHNLTVADKTLGIHQH
jgi:hypothetical protein